MKKMNVTTLRMRARRAAQPAITRIHAPMTDLEVDTEVRTRYGTRYTVVFYLLYTSYRYAREARIRPYTVQ